jgi:hypothetical protein
MKNVRILCAAVVLLAGMAASVSAAELSKSTLSSMGLGRMQLISDNDGLAIRGKGATAIVFGDSVARAGGSHSSNGYLAISSHNHSSAFAVGASAAIAAGSVHNHLSVGFSAGASVSFAK